MDTAAIGYEQHRRRGRCSSVRTSWSCSNPAMCMFYNVSYVNSALSGGRFLAADSTLKQDLLAPAEAFTQHRTQLDEERLDGWKRRRHEVLKLLRPLLLHPGDDVVDEDLCG